jgi:hypothetical protein
MPAFFCTCIDVPEDYYHVWVRDNEIDDEGYWRYFTNLHLEDRYTHVLTLPIEDKEFDRYMSSLYEQVDEGDFFPGRFRYIPKEDIANAQKWVDDFPLWKQEKERQRRESLLNDYLAKTKGKEQMKLF